MFHAACGPPPDAPARSHLLLGDLPEASCLGFSKARHLACMGGRGRDEGGEGGGRASCDEADHKGSEPNQDPGQIQPGQIKTVTVPDSCPPKLAESHAPAGLTPM